METVKALTRFLFLLTLTAVSAGAADPVPLPPRDKFHLFLLAGQSNMAGRGLVEAVDATPHKRVLMLNKAGEWVPAVDPLHFDKPVAGTGLGKTFAVSLAEANPDITIGLIPAAVGGSPIDTWKPGVFYEPTRSYPWDDAIRKAHKALEAGVLKGILWHQGESDSTGQLAPSYRGKLDDLIARLRKELQSPYVPFVAGQIGRFAGSPWSEWKETVDRAHKGLPQRVPRTAYVSSEGLEDKGDKTHFTAAAYREFGKRYAAAYLRLVK